MKILVTGSSGKLGAEVVKLLKKNSIPCRGIDIVEAYTTDLLIDIRDREAIKKAVLGTTAIIHTAALHGKHLDLNYPIEEFIQTNILGTLYLLEEAIKNRVEKFIYTSTTSIYGNAMVDDTTAVWVDEELTPVPRDIYDITKQAGENLCRVFFEREKLQTCVLRVSRFMQEPENAIVNYRLYRGLDEEDGAMAHLLAIMKHFEKFEVFNISNKSPFTKQDLEALKKNPKEVIVRYYPGAEDIYRVRGWYFPVSIDRVYDISKANQVLGYTPKNNFIDILKK